jgi:DNA polymerase-3 subunit beta
MNLKTTKKDLLDVMQKAYPLVPMKSTLQILSNFKISLDAANLEIAATDLDHSIKVHSTVAGEGSFSIIVNARKVFEVVRELPEGDVYIRVKDSVFIIESEKGFSCKLAGADPADFPAFPEMKIQKEIEIDVAVLSDMTAKSAFAVSRDESRACLCGIFWEMEKGRMGMVATDGHRLGSSAISGTFGIEEKTGIIVSPKTLQHIVKISSDAAGQKRITAQIGDKYVIFCADSFSLCSKLIDGPYPDYRKVIPIDNPRKVVIQRDLLINAVKRVAVLSNQKTNLVKFTFKKNQLELVVLNRDIGGEAREVLPVEYAGNEHAIGFNGQYLSEIAGIIATPRISMEMNTQISACLLFPYYEDKMKKASDDLFLIMPLKIMDEI